MLVGVSMVKAKSFSLSKTGKEKKNSMGLFSMRLQGLNRLQGELAYIKLEYSHDVLVSFFVFCYKIYRYLFAWFIDCSVCCLISPSCCFMCSGAPSTITGLWYHFVLKMKLSAIHLWHFCVLFQEWETAPGVHGDDEGCHWHVYVLLQEWETDPGVHIMKWNVIYKCVCVCVELLFCLS